MSSSSLFSVHRSELLPALAQVLEAVDNKNTIPILTSILLTPEGERLWLRATDLSLEVETSCEMNSVSNARPVAISGRDFHSIVKNLPEAAVVELAAGKNDALINVTAGNARFSLFTLPAGDFPSMRGNDEGVRVSISANTLAKTLGRVAYAVDTEGDRYYLQGVNIQPYGENKLAIAGCDGKNLAVCRLTVEEAEKFSPIILPMKAASAFRKLMADAKSSVVLTIASNKIRFDCDELSITSTLIDGTYPDYMRIVPSPDKKAVVSVASLRTAVDRVRLVVRDIGKDGVKLVAENNILNLSVTNRDGEYAGDEIAGAYDDERIEIGFNSRFMLRMLDSIATSDTEILLGDPSSPMIFKPTSDLDEFFVLMPMRV